jgi:ABC-2 type transport system ATP-binding protein
MNAIEIRGLTHRFRDHTALDDVTVDIPEGAVYALLGPNGAGKSTLMHLVMGLLPTMKGEIRVMGKPRRALTTPDRAAVSYIAEGQRLPGWMTLGALEAYLAPLYPRWDRALANDLRARFRLRSGQKVGTMSRGEHMKAALLCALAPRPRLLLMDEPFTGIDVAAKDELARGALLAAGEDGTTIVISSHDIGEIEPMCDWIGYIDQGRMKLSRPLEELREEYRGVIEPPSLREIFIALASENAPTPEPVP